METSKYWQKFKGKKVRLIIEDTPYPRSKDGIFVDYDNTHIFLQIENVEEPKPFSRHSIKRVDITK